MWCIQQEQCALLFYIGRSAKCKLKTDSQACCSGSSCQLTAVLVQPSPSPALLLLAWLTNQPTNQPASYNNCQDYPRIWSFLYYTTSLSLQVTCCTSHPQCPSYSTYNSTLWKFDKWIYILIACVMVSFWPWLGKRPPCVSILVSLVANYRSCSWFLTKWSFSVAPKTSRLLGRIRHVPRCVFRKHEPDIWLDINRQ